MCSTDRYQPQVTLYCRGNACWLLTGDKDKNPPPYDSLPQHPPPVGTRDVSEYSYTALPQPAVQPQPADPPIYDDAQGQRNRASASYVGPDRTDENYCQPINPKTSNHSYRAMSPNEQNQTDELELHEVS